MITALTDSVIERPLGLVAEQEVHPAPKRAARLAKPNSPDRSRVVRPGDLGLEIIETSALEDLARVSQIIEACRTIGGKRSTPPHC